MFNKTTPRESHTNSMFQFRISLDKIVCLQDNIREAVDDELSFDLVKSIEESGDQSDEVLVT